MKRFYLLIVWFLLMLALSFFGAFDAPAQPAPFGFALALVIPLVLYFIDRARTGARLFAGFHELAPERAAMIQTYRVVGVLFLMEWIKGRLPGGFALSAGTGDFIVGLLAPWVAWSLKENKPYAGVAAVAWNWLGILDLVMAVGLGVAYSASPLGIFARGGLTSREMVQYPLSLIPAWVVPISFILHFRSLQALAGKRSAAQSAPATRRIS